MAIPRRVDMKEPKYLVQLLERTEHFCKLFKLVTLAKLPEWVEEAKAVADICSKRNPTHSYVMYISNNPVDLAKGEGKLIQQEAIKKLKGEQSKVGITTSTKAMYLGMSRAITSFDFDAGDMADNLRNDVVQCLRANGIHGEYTNTPNGIHVHISSKDVVVFKGVMYPHLIAFMDKVGHDLCSPIEGTTKDGFLITKHTFGEPE